MAITTWEQWMLTPCAFNITNPFSKICGGQSSNSLPDRAYHTEHFLGNISCRKNVCGYSKCGKHDDGRPFCFSFFEERDRKKAPMILSSHTLSTCCTAVTNQQGWLLMVGQQAVLLIWRSKGKVLSNFSFERITIHGWDIGWTCSPKSRDSS